MAGLFFLLRVQIGRRSIWSPVSGCHSNWRPKLVAISCTRRPSKTLHCQSLALGQQIVPKTKDSARRQTRPSDRRLSGASVRLWRHFKRCSSDSKHELHCGPSVQVLASGALAASGAHKQHAAARLATLKQSSQRLFARKITQWGPNIAHRHSSWNC